MIHVGSVLFLGLIDKFKNKQGHGVLFTETDGCGESHSLETVSGKD